MNINVELTFDAEFPPGMQVVMLNKCHRNVRVAQRRVHLTKVLIVYDKG